MVLPQLLLAQISSNEELSGLSGRVRMHLQKKGWQLRSKAMFNDTVFYEWQNKAGRLSTSFFFVKAEHDPAGFMQKDVTKISNKYGSPNKIDGIEDEAYEWQGLKRGLVLMRLRKERVIIAVLGESAELVRELAKEMVKIVSDRTVSVPL
jgi:hypothetical protein